MTEQERGEHDFFYIMDSDNGRKVRVTPRPSAQTLRAYAGHCPSCGRHLSFNPPLAYGAMKATTGTCPCGRKWSMVFDIDKSGSFGVTGYQCDNEDRILDEELP